MLRWMLFLLILGGCYVAGDWLFQHPGEVQLSWFGYDIAMHVAVLGFVLLIFAGIVAFFAIQLWRIATWPARRRMRAQHRTFKRGLQQLTRGVAALAIGDESSAEDALKKALAALPGEPLPQLLSAQLLQRQGKDADAQAQFKSLMHYPATSELATRRLIEQHVARQEWREAMKLAEEARAKAPKDRWLLLSLIDFYAREHQTTQMLELTEGWHWQSPLTKEERNRFSALAYYLSAQHETNPRIKEKNLRHAVNYAPDFLPATIDYAYLLLAQDDVKRARKWLLAAWRAAPSPLLIAPILAAITTEQPRTQVRLLKPFLRGSLGATHHLLAAKQAMAASELVTARKALEAVLQLEESKEAATLMAELERKLRNDETANSWLNRAVNAPQSATWVCTHCGALHAAWEAHCGHCMRFDTLRYERPETRITSIETAPARMDII